MYTPREIVDYMCSSVEAALKEEFGLTLASPEVVILDPCTGTGNVIVNLIDRMPRRALAEAYQNRLFANGVMLLPYYREAYAKDSSAALKSKYGDMYVRFFRWASDRLGDRDGIVCFVSNNSTCYKTFSASTTSTCTAMSEKTRS